ncbi:MAG: hypothetical protein RL318_2071 [Fibrobacterota bacterium]|jgi:hypothetical protein
MTRSLKILALVPAAMLVVGCDDTTTNSTSETKTTETQSQSYADTKSKGAIILTMRDLVTGSFLSGVSASLLGNTAINATSNASGIAIFDSVAPGSRLVRIEKEGYAGRIVSADLADGASEVPRVHDVSLEVTLPKLGATVVGKVYFTDKLGNRNADSGATVYLDYAGNDWTNGHFSTVTDKDGNYTFKNLPEDIELNVTVRSQLLASGVFAPSGSARISGLKSDEVRNLKSINLSIDAEAFELLTTSIDALPENQSVSIHFSSAVDTLALRKGDIAVTSGTKDVAILPTWSNGNKTLTLKPFSGTWITGTNSIELSLKSPLGQSLSKSLTFTAGTVGALPNVVAGLQSKATILGKEKINAVDGNTASVNFFWNKAANADGYVLYKKARNENAFTKIGETSDGKDTSYALNTAEMFDKGDTVIFTVVSFNAKGFAAIESAPKLTLTDIIAPKLIADPGDFAVPAEMNNSGSMKDSIKTNSLTFDFSEPVDTTARPVFSMSNNINAAVKKASDDSLAIVWEWVSKTQGKATLVVMPKYDATGLDIDIDVNLGAIKDENGLVATPQKAEFATLRAKQAAPVVVTP